MAHAKSVRSRIGLAAVAVGVVVFMLGAWSTAGGAKQGGNPKNPKGNNGTVKIDGADLKTKDNDPHVDCVFTVTFNGYDVQEGNTATVSFVGHPPTGGGSLGGGSVDISSGTGSDTYDLSAALAGITPHPQQGWHVKLTVHADGSQGADVKHKVFWVNCPEDEEETTTTEPEVTTTTEAEVTPTTVAEVEDVDETTTTEAEVKGVVEERPRAAPPEELAFTGSNHAMQMAAAGLALMLLGSLLVLGGHARPALRKSQS